MHASRNAPDRRGRGQSHCACGADAIKSYPASDIQALMDNKATPELQQKALGQIAKCKADNKAKK